MTPFFSNRTVRKLKTPCGAWLALLLVFTLTTTTRAEPILNIEAVLSSDQLERVRQADLIVIGEHHPNPEHHFNQASFVKHIAPKAVVFEMIKPGKGDALQDALRTKPPLILNARIKELEYGWATLKDYLPIITAAGSAPILGAAVSRQMARGAMAEGAAVTFGSQAERYGLDQALDPDQQVLRNGLQGEAHCGALPTEMLPAMVEAQRLRDAQFARQMIEAQAQFGSPVILITGNGHARNDWAVPMSLRRAAPDLATVSIGQVAKAAGSELYDIEIEAEPFDEGDPCAAFKYIAPP